MAKYFEVDVIITKRIFVKAEESEDEESVLDYIHGTESEDGGDITVRCPRQLLTQGDIDQAERHADKKYIDAC